jgi:hypothetical protein
MQSHKHSKPQALPSTKKHPELEKQSIFKVCDNFSCIHYDPHDSGGNNCTLLFALSQEGCRLYAQNMT